jgi:hypothetical protein
MRSGRFVISSHVAIFFHVLNRNRLGYMIDLTCSDILSEI